MRTEQVAFYSEGDKLSGILKLPDHGGAGRRPAIVQGPGWLGFKDAKLYDRYHTALVQAGFAVLIFDYRGFGDSAGEPGLLAPQRQCEDIRHGLTYLQTRSDIDPNRLGVFGSGGTGGGNAVYVAGVDSRVKAAVCQVGVADGEDWMHRMRREYEWVEFKQRLDEDRRTRVLTGESAMVSPREEIMVATPERKATGVKKDVDSRLPETVPLFCAEKILEYKPIAVVDRIAPRAVMLIAVEPDAVTPEDHSYAMYERARAPKKLVVQRGTSHYRAYEQYGHVVTPMIVDWFSRYVTYGGLEVREAGRGEESVVYIDPSPGG